MLESEPLEPMKSPIAVAAEYLRTESDGTTQMVQVRIGVPFKVKIEWECEAHVEGWHREGWSMGPQFPRGPSPLHALTLAILIADSLLAGVIERGGFVSLPNEPRSYLTRASFAMKAKRSKDELDLILKKLFEGAGIPYPLPRIPKEALEKFELRRTRNRKAALAEKRSESIETIDPSTATTGEYLWIQPDGSLRSIRVRIGLPQKSGIIWECEVQMDGLLQGIPNTRGETSLRAISLAIVFVDSILVSLIARGERLRYAEVPGDLGDGYLTTDNFLWISPEGPEGPDRG
jgi:hypothetical protein